MRYSYLFLGLLFCFGFFFGLNVSSYFLGTTSTIYVEHSQSTFDGVYLANPENLKAASFSELEIIKVNN